MVKTILNPLQKPATDEFQEKKSLFIGAAAHCESIDDILTFVESIRDKHPKARHVAFAAMCGIESGTQIERMSDDGEPSGTAGKPILDALSKSHTSNCVVTVTRYFGGILLGSAGLIRAYSTAASRALKCAEQATIISCIQAKIAISYNQIKTLDYLVKLYRGQYIDRQYNSCVENEIRIDETQWEAFRNGVTQAFNGKVAVTECKKCFSAVPISSDNYGE